MADPHNSVLHDVSGVRGSKLVHATENGEHHPHSGGDACSVKETPRHGYEKIIAPE